MPDSEQLKSKNLTRRQVLIGLGNLSLGGVLLTIIRSSLRFLTPPISRVSPAKIVTKPPEAFSEGLTLLPENPVFMGRDKAGLFALSAICTHLGCTVAHNGDEFVCPCHTSRFSNEGKNLSGPAARPLAHFRLILNGEGLVEIDLSQTVPPDFRLQS